MPPLARKALFPVEDLGQRQQHHLAARLTHHALGIAGQFAVDLQQAVDALAVAELAERRDRRQPGVDLGILSQHLSNARQLLQVPDIAERAGGTRPEQRVGAVEETGDNLAALRRLDATERVERCILQLHQPIIGEHRFERPHHCGARRQVAERLDGFVPNVEARIAQCSDQLFLHQRAAGLAETIGEVAATLLGGERAVAVDAPERAERPPATELAEEIAHPGRPLLFQQREGDGGDHHHHGAERKQGLEIAERHAGDDDCVAGEQFEQPAGEEGSTAADQAIGHVGERHVALLLGRRHVVQHVDAPHRDGALEQHAEDEEDRPDDEDGAGRIPGDEHQSDQHRHLQRLQRDADGAGAIAIDEPARGNAAQCGTDRNERRHQDDLARGDAEPLAEEQQDEQVDDGVDEKLRARRDEVEQKVAVAQRHPHGADGVEAARRAGSRLAAAEPEQRRRRDDAQQQPDGEDRKEALDAVLAIEPELHQDRADQSHRQVGDGDAAGQPAADEARHIFLRPGPDRRLRQGAEDRKTEHGREQHPEHHVRIALEQRRHQDQRQAEIAGERGVTGHPAMAEGHDDGQEHHGDHLHERHDAADQPDAILGHAELGGEQRQWRGDGAEQRRGGDDVEGVEIGDASDLVEIRLFLELGRSRAHAFYPRHDTIPLARLALGSGWRFVERHPIQFLVWSHSRTGKVCNLS